MPTYTIVIETDCAADELHETIASLDPDAEVYPGRLAGEERSFRSRVELERAQADYDGEEYR